LEALLKTVYPDGWSESDLHRDTGLARGTLDKILNEPQQHQPRPAVHYIKIEQLFDRLGEKLPDSLRSQYCFQPRYCQESPPRPAVIDPPPPPPLPPAANARQILVQKLWNLDYRDGQVEFEKLIQPSTVAVAFLVKTSDSKVQPWLIKRLARLVPGFTNAERFEIKISYRILQNFDHFWMELARRLNTSDTAEATIARLSELC
jgi:hypothetical protein